MTCETKFKREAKTSNATGISLLNLGEGFVAVKNDDEPTIPNAYGVIIQEKNQLFLKNNNNKNDNNNSIENNELMMLRLFYLGGISFIG